MLIKQDESLVILVDVQEKLMPLIHENEAILKTQTWILELANALSVPVAVSEQYPQGLGRTLPALASIAEQNKEYLYFDKVNFSCATSDVLLHQLQKLQRKHVILIGIEAHVCVFQSAIELRQQGYSVFVVADAVGSRTAYDRKMAFLD